VKRPDELKAPADLFRPEFLVQKSEVSLHARLAALQAWCDRRGGDEDVAMLIDPRCVRLRFALDGGYHWKMTGGQRMPDVVQNASASIVDALTYALAKIAATGAMDPRTRREMAGPRGALIPIP
jgi:hypothetical protein